MENIKINKNKKLTDNEGTDEEEVGFKLPKGANPPIEESNELIN